MSKSNLLIKFWYQLLLVSLALLTMPSSVIASSAERQPNNLSAATINVLIKRYERQSFKNFNAFVFEIYQSNKHLLTSKQTRALGRFIANQAVEPKERFIIHRLLGLYTRFKYGGEARRLLAKMVAIPTYEQPGVKQHKNPNFIKMQKLMAKTAKKFGLAYRNIDGRIYEVGLRSRGKMRGELIALHAHADVVPVNPDQWRLENGQQLDPFKLTQVNDRWYGRGTQDDKNGIVAVLFAMRVIKEEKVKLFNEFKLLINTTKETDSTAISYYLKRHPTPDYNIALDGEYPVVIAKKANIASLIAEFPVRSGKGHALGEVRSISKNDNESVEAPTDITVHSQSPSILNEAMKPLIAKFGRQYGDIFTLTSIRQSDRIILSLNSDFASLSRAKVGANKALVSLLFVHELHQAGLLKSNHVTAAALFAKQKWGLIDLVKQFNEFDSQATVFKSLSFSAESMNLTLDLRLPINKPAKRWRVEIEQALNDWRAMSQVNVQWSYSLKKPLYPNPDGKWLFHLLDIASENLKLPRRFGAPKGPSAVHLLPNGVQFGLSMPQQQYTGHAANEFKSIDQFLVDMQIVSEMMSRLGQMKGLQ